MPEESHTLNFVTLKVAGGTNTIDAPYGIFDHREFCDQFIKSIIYCIENHQLQIFGFVIISNQLHLIVGSPKSAIAEKIKVLKKISAREISAQIGKKLNTLDKPQTREQKELRRFFGRLLNSEVDVFWRNDEKYLELKLKNTKTKVEPISSDTLITYLTDNNRNYLQLGASAFTKLMMETMKL